MRYLSVCSGVEGASLAWGEIPGWEAVAVSEVDRQACAVLAHRFPGVRNLGDMRGIRNRWLRRIGIAPDSIDLLVGGTPCQSFSVAGLRRGLDDDRGGLALEFLRLARRTRPRWVVWENVPGVLSIDGGRVFGAFLGGLAELGYGFAYRVLDAQHFGIPQRRRRVFVVGRSGGDWRRSAAVLFERESLSGDTSSRRSARAESPGAVRGCVAFGGNNTSGSIDVATACNAHPGPHGRLDFETETFVVHPNGRVRMLTVQEREKLQGFAPDWTLVPFGTGMMPDGPRREMIGNSFAIPVVRWIGRRIQMIEDLPR